MFTVKKKFEINSTEVIDFARLLGRFGLRFKISDEYTVDTGEGIYDKEHFRRFEVYGTRKQLTELLEARDIIYDYRIH